MERRVPLVYGQPAVNGTVPSNHVKSGHSWTGGRRRAEKGGKGVAGTIAGANALENRSVLERGAFINRERCEERKRNGAVLKPVKGAF